MANLFDVMSIDIVRDKVMKYTYPTTKISLFIQRRTQTKNKELMILDVLNLYLRTW